ncbi:MAG: RNA polymerase sigma factor [Clostridia bacterium]|nr:RNA polymerase sigma factor [Clostridia bacterium]
MTDREVLALYENRDPEATAALQRQYGAYCAAIVGRILTDPRDAEECLNDLWLRVWQYLGEHRPLYLKGWLGAAARNCAISRYRQLAGQTLPLEDGAAELAGHLRDTPAEHMEAKALGEAISAFLKTQKEAERVAFVRRYWYGDGLEQVAQHMGWSVGKTKTVLFRLRTKLRTYLTKEGFLHGEQDS